MQTPLLIPTNRDPGQTPPMEQSDQDPYCEKFHNKAIEQIN